MPELVLEREFAAPLRPAHVRAAGRQGRGCFELHRVEWLESLLSMDGHRMVCRFRAADAESVRIALRAVGAEASCLWPGTAHERPALAEAARAAANVLVRRRFDRAVALEEVRAREAAGAGCLHARGVEFIRALVSLDGRRMICLYRAPDVESVRRAQREAGMPVEDVWAFRAVTPDAAAAS